MLTKICALILAFSIPFSAHAKKLEFIFDDWHVLTTGEEANKVCYIASIPKAEKGNFKKRSEPYILVSKFPGRKAEVSVSPGYSYRGGSEVEINIGKKKYNLRKIKGEIAWAEDISMDQKLIADMKAGKDLDAKGISQLGTYSIDTYSLKGFTNSYNKMLELCKM